MPGNQKLELQMPRVTSLGPLVGLMLMVGLLEQILPQAGGSAQQILTI